jgi:hypothetical protein
MQLRSIMAITFDDFIGRSTKMTTKHCYYCLYCLAKTSKMMTAMTIMLTDIDNDGDKQHNPATSDTKTSYANEDQGLHSTMTILTIPFQKDQLARHNPTHAMTVAKY